MRTCGIDGVIRFLETQTKAGRILVQVKGGKANPVGVRDSTTLEREKAMVEAGNARGAHGRGEQEAVGAGSYESAWGSFPRLQVVSVHDLLNERFPERHRRMGHSRKLNMSK